MSVQLRMQDAWEATDWRAITSQDPCSYCSRRFAGTLPEENDLDHIVSRRDGGGDEWTNLASACRRCNSQKGARPALHFLLWKVTR